MRAFLTRHTAAVALIVLVVFAQDASGQFFDTPQSGFPVVTWHTVPGATTGILAGIAVGDLDGDGDGEIVAIFGAGPPNENYLVVLEHNGIPRPGFPLIADVDAGAILIGEVDPNIPGAEIVCAAKGAPKDVNVINSNTGQSIPGWPRPAVGLDPTNTRPLIHLADLNGDGDYEVVYVAEAPGDPKPQTLFAYEHDGTPFPGFPIACPECTETDSRFHIGSVGDIDWDAKDEILAWWGNPEPGFFLSGSYAYEDDGQIVPGWPAFAPPPGQQALVFGAVVDLDGSAPPELFGLSGNTSVVTMRNDGSWISPVGEYVLTSGWPALTDSDGDGVVESYWPGSPPARVTVDIVETTVIPGFPSGTPVVEFYCAADFNGDGNPLLVATSGDFTGELSVIDPVTVTGLPGETVTGLGLPNYEFTPCVFDLDGDGDLEIIHAGYATIHVYDVPCPPGATPRIDWMGMGADPTRSLDYYRGRTVQFLRGDSNGDGSVNVADASHLLNFLFLGGSTSCVAATDVDSSDSIEITDAVYLLQHLFLLGPAPEHPYPACGRLPNTWVDLDCAVECMP